MNFRSLVPVLFFFAASSSALAQEKWEVAPFVGYETSGSFPITNSLNFTHLRANSGTSFGTFLDRSYTEKFQFEFMWNRNMTSFSEQRASDGVYQKAFNSDIDQFQFGVLLMFRGSERKLRPYFAGGLGFTHDSNSGGTPNRTQFSYGIGGGVKYMMNRHFGLRGDLRFVPTYENKSLETFCDFFGCFTANVSHYLNRGNFTGGLIFRF